VIPVAELEQLKDRLQAEVKELEAMIAREKAYAGEAAGAGTGTPRPRIR
jgi:hypothetical protein